MSKFENSEATLLIVSSFPQLLNLSTWPWMHWSRININDRDYCEWTKTRQLMTKSPLILRTRRKPQSSSEAARDTEAQRVKSTCQCYVQKSEWQRQDQNPFLCSTLSPSHVAPFTNIPTFCKTVSSVGNIFIGK